MRRWALAAAAAMLVGCGGSPVEAVINEVTPPGDGGGAESAMPDGDGGEHASDAADARADGPGAPHEDGGAPEASPEAGDEPEPVDAGGDAPATESGTPVGTCPGGTAALGCADFAGTTLCVAEGVNLSCSDFMFSSSSAAQSQYDQYKSAGWPDCAYGGQPVPNPKLTAPGQDCVVLYGLEVQAFYARCPSGSIPNDGGC